MAVYVIYLLFYFVTFLKYLLVTTLSVGPKMSKTQFLALKEVAGEEEGETGIRLSWYSLVCLVFLWNVRYQKLGAQGMERENTEHTGGNPRNEAQSNSGSIS